MTFAGAAAFAVGGEDSAAMRTPRLRSRALRGASGSRARDDDSAGPEPEVRVNGRGTSVGEDGRYELRRLLGRGGMGSVFLAWDRRLERFVAVKVCGDLDPVGSGTRERFRREARMMAALRHARLVRILDFFPWQGRLHMVQEYVDGSDLVPSILAGEFFHPDEGRRLLRQMAEGLAYLHQEGYVHRDLKPSNVLHGKDGTYKITDFGLSRHLMASRLTRSVDVVGTPRYHPPEAMTNGEVDARGDLYQVGIIVAEVMAGRTVFEEEDRPIWLLLEDRRRFRPDELPSRIPPDLKRVICGCCTFDPAERFADGADLLEFLDEMDRDGASATRRHPGAHGGTTSRPLSAQSSETHPSPAGPPADGGLGSGRDPSPAARPADGDLRPGRDPSPAGRPADGDLRPGRDPSPAGRPAGGRARAAAVFMLLLAGALVSVGFHLSSGTRGREAGSLPAASGEGGGPLRLTVRPCLDGVRASWTAGTAVDLEIRGDGEESLRFRRLRKGRFFETIDVVDRDRSVAWSAGRGAEILAEGRFQVGLRESFRRPSWLEEKRTNRPVQLPVVHQGGFDLNLVFGQLLSFGRSDTPTGTVPVLRWACHTGSIDRYRIVAHVPEGEGAHCLLLDLEKKRLLRIEEERLLEAWASRSPSGALLPVLGRDLPFTAHELTECEGVIEPFLELRPPDSPFLVWQRRITDGPDGSRVEALSVSEGHPPSRRFLGRGSLLDRHPVDGGVVVLWQEGTVLRLSRLDLDGHVVSCELPGAFPLTGPEIRRTGLWCRSDGRDWLVRTTERPVWARLEDGTWRVRSVELDGELFGVMPSRKERSFRLVLAKALPGMASLGTSLVLRRLVLPERSGEAPLLTEPKALPPMPLPLDRLRRLGHGLSGGDRFMLIHGGDALMVFRAPSRPRLVARRAYATALFGAPIVVGSTLHLLFHDLTVLSADGW